MTPSQEIAVHKQWKSKFEGFSSWFQAELLALGDTSLSGGNRATKDTIEQVRACVRACHHSTQIRSCAAAICT